MEEKPAAQETTPTAPATPSQPPTTKDTPPPETKSSLWTIIIIVLVGLILAVAAFIAYKLGAQPKTASPATPPATTVQTPTSPTPTVSQKKIAYSKDKTVWLVSASGADKKMLVATPSGVTYIAGGAWKDANNFTYISCQNTSCAALTHNLANDLEVKEAEQPSLAAVAWNRAGTQMAYLSGPSSGPAKLSFKSGGTATVVKTFAVAGGRGGSLDDNVSIYFSPDDKYVLVTDTATQPNATDKNTIWVFDAAGKELVKIAGTSGWATQARWADNNRFLYKMGDSVYAYYLDGTPSQKIMSEKSLQNPIPFGQQLYYWVNEDLPRLGGGTKLTGYYRPEVLDATHLIVLKAKKLSPEEAVMMSFTTAGLSVIDLATNKAIDLDTGDVTFFSVSP